MALRLHCASRVDYDEEYHVWPSAAGGAWTLIALDKPTFNLFR